MCFNAEDAEEFNQDDSYQDRPSLSKRQRTMLETENMKKNNEQIHSMIAKKETELSKLKITKTEFDKHTEDMKKILEEISQSEKRKEQAESKIGDLRDIVNNCNKTIKECNNKIKNCNKKITGLEEEKNKYDVDVNILKDKLKKSNTLFAGKTEKLKLQVDGESGKEKIVSHLMESIDEKKKTLECPVCLEVVEEAPIYRCEQEHLVCSSCRLQIRKCPECRVDYEGEPVRHRFAEMMAQDLLRLREQLAAELAKQ